MIKFIWRFYIEHLRTHWQNLVLGVLGSVFAAALLLTYPWLIRHAFDVAIPNEQYNVLLLLALAALGLQGLYLVVSLYVRKLNFSISMALTGRIRRAAIEKLYRLSDKSYSFLDRASLHAKVIIDIERIDRMTSALFGILLPSALIGGLLVTGMMVISWKLSVVAFLVFGSFIPVSHWVAKRYGDIADRYQGCVRQYSSKVEFSILNFILTRLKSAEKRDIAGHQAVIDRLAKDGEQLAVWRGLFTELHNLFAFATAVALLGVGIAATYAGWLSLGDVLAFYVFAMLFRGQYVIFSQGLPPVLEGEHSLSAIEEMMSLEEARVHSGTRPMTIDRSIRLRDVAFGYGEEMFLEKVDLELCRGEWVGLAGANGSGKTTIVKLLVGLLEPGSGDVLVDGTPLVEVDPSSLRRQIGVALQEPMIFGGTIGENIAYGEDRVDVQKVTQAAQVVGLDTFVRSLPDGYGSYLGESGIMISGGQRQKISLARAIHSQPGFLILDEPTNHLDRGSIAHLFAALAAMPQRPGVLIISNDEQVLARLERLYSLDNGVVHPVR